MLPENAGPLRKFPTNAGPPIQRKDKDPFFTRFAQRRIRVFSDAKFSRRAMIPARINLNLRFRSAMELPQPQVSLPKPLNVKRLGVVGMAVWAVSVVAGFKMLLDYETKPGPDLLSPMIWPADGLVPLSSKATNLVLIAHPRCPCTRASIAELEKVMTKCAGQVKATVLFLQPSSEPDDWSKTALWRRASAIPEVEVMTDRDGKLAARFGASTSGQVLLFSANGQLLFSGGITDGRGHEGDNAGADAVVTAAHGRPPAIMRTPVFGCSILDEKPERTGPL